MQTYFPARIQAHRCAWNILVVKPDNGFSNREMLEEKTCLETLIHLEVQRIDVVI